MDTYIEVAGQGDIAETVVEQRAALTAAMLGLVDEQGWVMPETPPLTPPRTPPAASADADRLVEPPALTLAASAASPSTRTYVSRVLLYPPGPSFEKRVQFNEFNESRAASVLLLLLVSASLVSASLVRRSASIENAATKAVAFASASHAASDATSRLATWQPPGQLISV